MEKRKCRIKGKRIIAFLLSALMMVTMLPDEVRADGYGYGDSRALYVESNYSGGSGKYYLVSEPYTYYLDANEFTREGYTIIGWAESPGGGVRYRNGQSFSVTEGMTLYAVWGIASTTAAWNDIVYVHGIPWKVIDVDTDQWLLISADVLGGLMGWNAAKEYCGTVYTSFSSLEQAAVALTNKTDSDYYTYQAVNLENAKLFLLSVHEAITYFSSDAERLPGDWWLRSSQKDNSSIVGAVIESGHYALADLNYNFVYGVRPAFNLNRLSVLFLSDVEGGKSSAASGEFVRFRETTSTGRKLTLLDSDRSFSASADKSSVMPGDTLTVTYSGAGSGANEYVSAMICDSNGAFLYYASISAGNGTWNLTIPSDLQTGTYKLKVFSEQQNGDKNTDYASPMSEITLTVGDVPVTAYSVTVNKGTEMTKTSDSGAASQSDLTGAMTAVVYTANEGYYFPEDYSVSSVNGISVERDGYTQIIVSGTPTADTEITLPAATAKTTPSAPTTPVAVGCTNSANDDGKITDVTTAMEYKKSDDLDWTVVTGTEITGLTPGTYNIRFNETDTSLASEVMDITIAAYTAPEQVAAPTFSPAGGTYSSSQSVTISCTTSGADIYYTTDGTAPISGSTKYTGAIAIASTTTIKAIAVKSGMTDSAVATATYTINSSSTDPVVTPPTAKSNLVYNGQPQELVNPGTVVGGTLYYAVTKAGDLEPSAELYTTSIPVKTDAGTYYVWYKVAGDGNHKGTDPQKLEIEIVFIPSLAGGRVTAPAGARLILVRYVILENSEDRVPIMTSVKETVIAEDCAKADPAVLLGLSKTPVRGCKLLLLDPETDSPLCEAWEPGS